MGGGLTPLAARGVTEGEAMTNDERNIVVCRRCGADAEWIECWAGCEDGYYDGFEDDPMWYDEGDYIPCDTCSGRGGWWGCCNLDCPPGQPVSHVTYDVDLRRD